MQFYRSLTVYILAVAFIAGCGGKDEVSKNTFFYNEHDNFNTLDPALIGARASGWAGSQIFVGLVGLDSTMHPIPKLAKEWSVSEDGRVWRFKLRTDARFADDPCFPDGKGRTVTAEDVRYSFERVCRPETKSSGVWVFRGKVKGVDEYIAGFDSGKPPEHVEGLRVIDDSTFEIELIEPFAPFLSMLTIPYCFIVPHEAVEKYGEDFFQHPVGAGPFRLVEWVPDQRMTMSRNANYFERDAQGNRLPYLDSISVTFIRDLRTEFTEFQRGNLDMISGLEPTFVDAVFAPDGKSLTAEYSKYTLYLVPSMSITYYGFQLDPGTPGGTGSPFVDNRYLRRALNYAIDRDAIVRYVLKGQSIAATHGPIPPGTPGYSGVEGYHYDRDLAKRLLDSAGYPDAKGLPEIVIQMSDNERTKSVGEVVQEQLAQIGIKAQIRQVQFPQHREMYKSAKLPIWVSSWIADYPDAENFMGVFYSQFIANQGPNTTHFSNPTFDSLYRAALDPHLSIEERAAIYNRAERIVLDDAPWIFLTYSLVQRLTQPGISGYTVDPLDRLDLTYVRKQQQ